MDIMKHTPIKKKSKFCASALVALAFILSITATAQETVLYTFTGAGDGGFPQGTLIPDGKGNFYGASTFGGSFAGVCSFTGCGNVFELAPNLTGGWTVTSLYNFTGGADGAIPGAGLIMDAAGNLYGTTDSGGYLHNSNCGLVIGGCGVVFELSPNGSGGWTESVLYAFHGGVDGFLPQTGVVFDASGNLYGTANLGGGHQVGEIFQLSPNGSGGWTYRGIHAFTNGSDGGRPSGLMIDSSGNLFTTTTQGGKTAGNCQASGCGSILELSPNGSGGWTRQVAYEFTGGEDGAIPIGISMDSSGNLWGAAEYGGLVRKCSLGSYPGCGVVFELTPIAGGHWQRHVPYLFTGGSDGASPAAAPIFDTAGNVYGTSNADSTSSGAVYKLSPITGGWSETTLYTFTGGSSGAEPSYGLLLDSSGNLVGMTEFGGIDTDCTNEGPGGCGVVYQITP